MRTHRLPRPSTLAPALLALALPLHLVAGDKAQVVEAAVVPAEEPLGATLSVGYMSHYVFYGVDYGGNAVWTGLDYTIGQLPIPVDIGVWYVNPTDGLLDDELDLYASIGGEVAGFDAALTMLGYFYPDSGDEATYELGLSLERSLGWLDWNATASHDFVIEGWYFETGLSKAFSLCDAAELVISGGVSYQIDYHVAGGQWNHAYAMISLPIALREEVLLEPYVAGLFALDAVEAFQDDIVHGGVSLSVSF